MEGLNAALCPQSKENALRGRLNGINDARAHMQRRNERQKKKKKKEALPYLVPVFTATLLHMCLVVGKKK